MQPLEISDVEQIVNLLARAGDPTVEMSLPERKRMLLEGTANLVGADVWYWSNVTTNPALPGDVMATFLIDGGYAGEPERVAYYEFLADQKDTPVLNGKAFAAVPRGQHCTYGRGNLFTDSEWQRYGGGYRATGFEHFLFSVYPVSADVVSCIGFHRRADKPDYSERDRAIVHVIFQQVDWLHRHGTNAPAGKKVIQLSPRERQVLIFLLGGDSLKEVAHKLTLSEHTVAIYVKQIYRCFAVNSRGELLAHFISGGQHES